MKRFFLKPYRWAIIFSLLLVLSSAFVLLDTFVIPKAYKAVVDKGTSQSGSSSGTAKPIDSDQSGDFDPAKNLAETKGTLKDGDSNSDGTGVLAQTDGSAMSGSSYQAGNSDNSGSTDQTNTSNQTERSGQANNSTQSNRSANMDNAAQTGYSNKTDNAVQTGRSTQADNAASSDHSNHMDNTAKTQSEPVITDNSYEDSNIKISIETIRKYDTQIYIADIQLTDTSYLKTALADNMYGRNIKAATSEIAKDNNAIFAINGDFYGFRNYGYVLRNGVLYRDKAGKDDSLVIDKEGNFSIINEGQVDIDSLELDTIWQVLSFGPALIKNSEITVNSKSEVAQSMSSNPRTALGQISPLHYIFIVSDGRTSESAGLSLLELAKVFEGKGCTAAYNLDGGGSATMYFNGSVVNIPTDGWHRVEREVSDIVYIGY